MLDHKNCPHETIPFYDIVLPRRVWDCLLIAWVFLVVLHNGAVITENYPTSLDRLDVGTRVGVNLFRNGYIHPYLKLKGRAGRCNHIDWV